MVQSTRSPAAAVVQHSVHALLHTLLRRLHDAPELQFVRGVLLESMDGRASRHEPELLPTLEAYLNSGCSAVRTSQVLGVHRNSVQYRLQRIYDRLGFDLADPDARLLVQIALHGGGASPETDASASVRLGDATIDFRGRRALLSGYERRLTPTEVELLRFFMAHPDTSHSGRAILDAVWGGARRANEHTLHVYINRLRRKLEADPNTPRHLVTDGGAGYRLVTSAA
ncbi:MAG: helix-turn-helix domain-containing protein [Chloroflexi bacterium]|nr:helix-turn-helix domain-containing protein [Chloroflexota bacterium]